MTLVRPPDGFTLALLDGWVTLDLDAGTSEVSRRRKVDALAADASSVEEFRDGIEGFLSAAVAGAAEDEALLCALHVDIDTEGRPVVVTVLVAIRSVEGPADPSVLADLGLLTQQYYLPVPGTDQLLAVVAFASPTLALEGDLIALFDTIADSFAFT